MGQKANKDLITNIERNIVKSQMVHALPAQGRRIGLFIHILLPDLPMQL